MRGIASPLPTRRIHPRHKWRGILRGSHKKTEPFGLGFLFVIGDIPKNYIFFLK
jgi:hypothetical protein